MADNNNKISIDIEINANGQQQINQYKSAFEGLRTSITNLSNPISKLDNDISKLNNTLNKTGTQNDVGDTITKLINSSKEAPEVLKFFSAALNIVKTGVISLEGALTGGLTVLLAFLPEIVNFATSLFKGKDAVNAMALSFQNLNAARKAANADVATENTKLQMLYKSATDVKNSHEDRVKSIHALQQAYPQHFKGLKEEDFLNGKAKTGFDAATKSILENARAKAALSKITDEANKIANAEYQIEKIRNANHNEIAQKERELAKEPRRFRDMDPKLKLANYKKESDERARIAIAEQQQIINASQNSVKSLTKFGGGTNKIAGIIAGDNTNVNESGSFNYVEKKKPKPKPEPKLPPREFEELNAKSPGVNFDFDTSKTEEQKQQDLNALNALDPKMDPAVKKTQATQEEIDKIEEYYAKKKADREDGLANAKIHAGDRFIDAALKNSKKDSAIYKAAFLAKKATSIADTIISTKRAVMESFKAYAGIPFVGQALGIIQAVFMAGQGAMSIAEIAKQKPGFARGGQFRSDGRGSLLSGYSRMDDTNAYLRSGEAVVVSEAMRNPWARNLVSAINVAYGGRDFSMSNPNRGYAIGDIFTDGGNSNRYYNQPMNDQKDLANTIAYQMINNFPPVYVDVKDINTQQNIMAQTINRVNLYAKAERLKQKAPIAKQQHYEY